MRANKGTWLRCSWLAPVMLVGLAACCCPKPEPVNPPDLTPEQQQQVSTARTQLKGAETRGAWTPEDDEAYSNAIATLPEATRFQLAKDLVSRLNDQKIRVVHRPRGNGHRVCPALCPARVTTTTTTPTPPTPATTDVPGKGTPVPAAPNKPATTPAAGKPVVK